MENEIPGTQAAMGCTCGQPRTVGVMHRSEGPCQVAYATAPSECLSLDEALLKRITDAYAARYPIPCGYGCNEVVGEVVRLIEGSVTAPAAECEKEPTAGDMIRLIREAERAGAHPTAQAKPDLSGLVKIPDGPPIPEWLARAVYEGWKARALLDSTYEQFTEKYSRFLDWETIGDLYRDTRAKNGKTPKQVIDAAIALLAHSVAQAKSDTRDAVLEEAAKACETQFVGLGGPPDDPHPDAVLVNGAVYDCAKAIRALKVKPEGDVS